MPKFPEQVSAPIALRTIIVLELNKSVAAGQV